MDLGNKILMLRKQANITQEQLAGIVLKALKIFGIVVLALVVIDLISLVLFVIFKQM